MKAALLEGIEKLKITEIATPKPQVGEVLIKVKACAICGTDIKVFHHGHRLITFPRVTGHEVTGEIIEVAQDVSKYKVGDRVAVAPAVPCGDCYYCHRGKQAMCENLQAIGYFWNGGFAEYMIVPKIAVDNGCVNILPDNVSFEEGALAEPLACVINGQELSNVGMGDTVVIIGTGPMGCLHAELARAIGATKTVMIEVSEERLELARKTVDADLFINSREQDSIKLVKDLTQGRGADKVIVACGVGKAQEDALKMVANLGNVNFFGGLPKDKPYIQLDSNILHYKECSITGTHGSSPCHNQTAINLIASGKIRIKKYITKNFKLDDLAEAIARAETGKEMKIIITP